MMKRDKFNLFLFLAFVAAGFSSCKKEDDEDTAVEKTSADKKPTLVVKASIRTNEDKELKTDEVVELSSSKKLSFLAFSLAGPEDSEKTIEESETFKAKWTVNPKLPPTVSGSRIKQQVVVGGDYKNFYVFIIGQYTLDEDTDYTIRGDFEGQYGTRTFTLRSSEMPVVKTDAELTGVLYALQQYATPDNDGNVALTFVDPSQALADSKIYVTISDGATITKPATAVKTSDENVGKADEALPGLKKSIPGLKDVPAKLIDTNVWEIELPTTAEDITIEVKSKDGTKVEYTLTIAAVKAAKE